METLGQCRKSAPLHRVEIALKGPWGFSRLPLGALWMAAPSCPLPTFYQLDTNPVLLLAARRWSRTCVLAAQGRALVCV